ncbi:unnamed protein product [Prunus armeniaca]|uniref:Uncharacterized protein n=1 Tax=Prunus armeniaca TaxID=36596 RepID=A0A6J5TYN4_PRUAR|nr:unnamed protein product [Prunus armeniaca]
MSNMRELDLKDCRNLDDIPGLEDSSKFTETIHMEGCTNLSARFRKNILERWAVSGGGGLFFSGNDIPVNEDEIVYIDVPYSDIGALTLCIIYSSDDSQSSGRLSLTVTNRTQRTVFSIFPRTVSGVTPHEDYLWLGRIPNNGLNLKGGDKVHARAEFLREEGKKHLKYFKLVGKSSRLEMPLRIAYTWHQLPSTVANGWGPSWASFSRWLLAQHRIVGSTILSATGISGYIPLYLGFGGNFDLAEKNPCGIGGKLAGAGDNKPGK